MHLKDRLHSPEFFMGDPYPAYQALRASDPVCWNDVTKFWALLKYEDIRYVSSNPAKFSSAKGITNAGSLPSSPPVSRGKPHLHGSAPSSTASEAHQRRFHESVRSAYGSGQDPRPGTRASSTRSNRDGQSSSPKASPLPCQRA